MDDFIDFAKEFRQRIKLVDEIIDNRPIKLLKYSKKQRFNIHKRSLPPGIDTIVVYNVSKENAEWLMEKKLKLKMFTDDSRETKTYIFYEAIPVDATPRERNIYFNPKPLVLENDGGENEN